MLKALLAAVVALGAVIGIVAWIGSSGGGLGDATLHPTSTVPTTSTTLTAAQQAEKQESETWEDDVTKAFGGQGLSETISNLVNSVEAWKSGKESTDQLNSELDLRLQEFVAARDRMRAVRPYPRDPTVNDYYDRSADLYVEATRVYEDMTAFPPGSLRDQNELLAKRLRELGDRIFDRGRALVEPHLFLQQTPGVQVNLPEEVPNWVKEGLAAGPPLDDPPPPADRLGQVRQANRPTEPRATWLAAVGAAGVPDTKALAAAITAADGAKLQQLARSYVAAAEKLRGEPDPDGPVGREESARYRLSLLVRADAARAAQLGTVVGDPAVAARLAVTARRVALSADGLGPADTPTNPSGFDPALLLQSGA